MKNRWHLLLWLLLVGVVIAACSTNAPANQPQGPALVMFYTEG
jgi:hypothetical protein